jgi:hypothetical protein
VRPDEELIFKYSTSVGKETYGASETERGIEKLSSQDGVSRPSGEVKTNYQAWGRVPGPPQKDNLQKEGYAQPSVKRVQQGDSLPSVKNGTLPDNTFMFKQHEDTEKALEWLFAETSCVNVEGIVAPGSSNKSVKVEKDLVNFYHMGQKIATRTKNSCKDGYFLCPTCNQTKATKCHKYELLKDRYHDLLTEAQGTTKKAKKAWTLVLVIGLLDEETPVTATGKVQLVDDVDQDVVLKKSTIRDNDEIILSGKYDDLIGDEKDNVDDRAKVGGSSDKGGEADSKIDVTDTKQVLIYKDPTRTRLVVNNRFMIFLVALLYHVIGFVIHHILAAFLDLDVGTIWYLQLFMSIFHFYFAALYTRDDQSSGFKDTIMMVLAPFPKYFQPFVKKKMIVTMKFTARTPEEKAYLARYVPVDCRSDAMSLSQLKHDDPILMNVILDQDIPGATYKNRIKFSFNLGGDFPEEVADAYKKMRRKMNSPGALYTCACFLWCTLRRAYMRMAFVKISKKKRFSNHELQISSELLQQMLIPSITNPLETPEMVMIRLQRFVSSIHSVNVPKQMAYYGQNIHQDTVLLAYHMSQRYRYRRVDVNNNSLF